MKNNALKDVKRKRGDLSPEVPDIFEAAAMNDIKMLVIAIENGQLSDVDNHGLTALHHAVAGMADQAIQHLLHSGVDASRKDYFGRDAAWLAVELFGDEGLTMAETITRRMAETQYRTPDLANHP